ncbi:MAG: glutathione-regulated potassium-efflux system protein KefC [Methanoregulaceae archaeon PtaB.Bin056]|nr:MAG: glutathione-regulated potassium-efflux system protein KefC [Methanoregulaceae archaeon PtaB.Bin056]
MELSILYDILIIFGLSLLVGLLFSRIRIPPMIGYIVAGAIAGPSVLSLIHSPAQVDVLAEIGIILLLFSIGLEFSFRQLWDIKGLVLKGGAIQVILASAATIAVAFFFGRPWNEAVLLGFVVSLSSTAVVLKVLHDRGELDSPHGKLSLGILIFQDLVAIPMMMAVPFLAEVEHSLAEPLYLVLLKDILLVIILVAAAKWVMPWLLFQIARTRSSELFLLFVVSVCFGVAWLASFAGLSLAMGALLAGLLISESEFSHQAIGRIVPFRDIFTAFFFVSIGMLLDVGFFFDHVGLVLVFLAAALLLKFLTAAAAPVVLGYQMRTIILAGIALAQIGEFSFIITKSALDFGILSHEVYQVFLIVALATMALTPFLIASGPTFAGYICSHSLFTRLFPARCQWVAREERVVRSGHLVIIGYGVNGKNLARAAKIGGIEYAIIDMNPDSVRQARDGGEPIIYGDATTEGVLDHAGIETARIAVVAINDPVATRRIVGLCRQKNPGIFLVVRTRYLIEVPVLREIGADEVIPEEFETSIEIFTRVMRAYGIPADSIEHLVNDIRADSYQALRSIAAPPFEGSLDIPGMDVREVTVAEGAPIAGKTLGEILLKKQYGVTVLAVRRNGALIPHPDGTCAIRAGDITILTGTVEKIEGSLHLFAAPP